MSTETEEQIQELIKEKKIGYILRGKDREIIKPYGNKHIDLNPDKSITEIKSYEGLLLLECSNCSIKKLELVDSIIDVFCAGNKLKKLVVPKNVKGLNCSNNLLTELLVPDTIEILRCANNPDLEVISFYDKDGVIKKVYIK